MSAQHTPGPLKASKGWEGDPERWVVCSDGLRHYLVATIENGQPGDTCETEGHTARLFAAAPELLDALKIAQAHLKHICGYVSLHTTGYSFESIGEDSQLIDAAIAKAEGVPKP